MSKQAMKDMIKGMEFKLNKLDKERQKLEEAIHALQTLCEHKMVYNGHDSHYNYMKCSICGHEDNRC